MFHECLILWIKNIIYAIVSLWPLNTIWAHSFLMTVVRIQINFWCTWLFFELWYAVSLGPFFNGNNSVSAKRNATFAQIKRKLRNFSYLNTSLESLVFTHNFKSLLIQRYLYIPATLRNVPHNCIFTVLSEPFNWISGLVITEIQELYLEVSVCNYFESNSRPHINLWWIIPDSVFPSTSVW